MDGVSVYAWKTPKFKVLSVSVYAWKTNDIHRLNVENGRTVDERDRLCVERECLCVTIVIIFNILQGKVEAVEPYLIPSLRQEVQTSLK